MIRDELYRRHDEGRPRYERDPQAEADKELGRMLRQLPPEWELSHGFIPGIGAMWIVFGGCLNRAAERTPDAALSAALAELATTDEETEQEARP